MVIPAPEEFHDYTVSFLAYLIWDPVHMYNAVTNGWTDFGHQITFDVRRPKTHAFTMERLRKFIAAHPYVENGKFCVVNNTYQPQSTTVWKDGGEGFPLDLAANEIRWFEI